MLETRTAPFVTRAARVWKASVPIAVLLAITLILLWKLAFTNEYTWINSPDYTDQVVPWFQFQAKEWHAHRFPLWDPYQWCGQPLVGQAQPGAVYPLNWILFLLPLKDGHISIKYLHWYNVLIHFMAILFAYLLCREAGCSKTASILGGSAFSFSGFLGSTEWPQMMNGVVWAPLALLFFLRATRGIRPYLSSAVAGACVGIAFLSGHHQAPMFLALFMAGLWIHAFVSGGRAQMPKLSAMASLFFVFVFLLGAAQIIPAVEYGRIALRWVNAKDPVGWRDKVPYYVHWRYSTNPVAVLGIVVPGLYKFFNPFLGPTIFVLALGGVIVTWANRLVRVITAAGIASFLFSLGNYSPFHGFLYALIPDLEKARSPSAAVFLFQLAAAILAAFGLDNLIRSAILRTNLDDRWRKLAWCAWIFAAIIYTVLFAASVAQGDRVFVQVRTGVVALTALGVGAVLFASARSAISPAATASILIILAMVDLSTIVGYSWQSTEEGWNYVGNMRAASHLAPFLRAQPGESRVFVNRDDLEVNLGDWESVEQYNGYTGVSTNVFRATAYPQIRELLGEHFYVARKPGAPDDREVYQDPASGLRVYTRGEPQPRVWTAHQTVAIKDNQHLGELDRPVAELRSKVVVTGTAPVLEVCGTGDQVRSLEHGPANVAVNVQMACKGMLVLADTFTPGWNATVDGRPVPIYETYGAVRGVVVPTGTHVVEFRYRPMSVLFGAGLTASGVILLLAMSVFARLRA